MTHEDELALRRILDDVDLGVVEGDGAALRARPLVVAMRPLAAPNPHRTASPCPFLVHVWKITSESTLRDVTMYCAVCGWSYPEIAADIEAKQKCAATGCTAQRTAGTAFCGEHQ